MSATAMVCRNDDCEGYDPQDESRVQWYAQTEDGAGGMPAYLRTSFYVRDTNCCPACGELGETK